MLFRSPLLLQNSIHVTQLVILHDDADIHGRFLKRTLTGKFVKMSHMRMIFPYSIHTYVVLTMEVPQVIHHTYNSVTYRQNTKLQADHKV